MPLAPITHARTLAQLLAERLARGKTELALHAPQLDGGVLIKSWLELGTDVAAMCEVFRRAGVSPGDRVAQLSENRYEWLLVDFACVMLQAVHVPLHASLAGHQALEQINHSGAKLAFVSTRDQAAKLAAIADLWPAQLQFISHSNCDGLLGDRWLGETDQLLRAHPAEFQADRFSSTIDSETLATILYTSGTTGEPKGVMLTHGNLVTNATSATTAFGQQPEEVKLNFLPLSHIFARTCDLYSWLVRGGQLVIASSRENVLPECQRFQPTVLNGVPYFFERVYRSLCEQKLHETPGVLRKVLGGQIRFCNSGGAALAPHVFDFFHAQGVPLLEGYGLSESSPVITLSTVEAFRRRSCGRPIENVEVSIAEDGEILTRGPHVMHGYYLNPEATADAMASGWLRTGDLGRLDDDGFLYITGRKKELLVLSSGKNIAPVYLESLLTSHPSILQAMIVGDAQSYLTALIVPSNPEDATKADAYSRYERLINDLLSLCSYHEQVRRFTLLATPFSIERGELTPKLSLRRAVIAEHYADQIKAMYATEGRCGADR